MSSAEPAQIDRKLFDLYDAYCHGRIGRRQFLARATALGTAGLAMAHGLMPDYARAQTIAPADNRIRAAYATYASPGGNSGTMRGYLAHPAGQGPWPAVLVIHENRGLNPYIEDVARRAAVAGFIALAPDGLAPLGGYPGNDDDGRALQAKLDPAKLRADMLNGARHLKAHRLSTGKLGVTGFCWGGETTNFLAVALGAELQAAAPFYGAAPHGMSLPGFMKHLRVLEDAGLVARAKEGRVVSCELSAAPMQAAAAWMQRYEKFWTEKLDALARYLYQQEELQRWNKPESGKGPSSSSSASTRSRRKSSGARGPSRRR